MEPDQIEHILRESPTLVLDTETSGLSWKSNHSIGYVVTWGPAPGETIYLPFAHAGGGNLTWDVKGMFRTVLAPRQDVRLVFHNAAFDLNFFHADGVDFKGKFEDTLIDCFLVNELAPSFSLEACCRDYRVQEKRGQPLYDRLASMFGGKSDRSQMQNYWRLAGNDLIGSDYAAGDGTSTWQLWEVVQPELDAQDLRRVWDVECRCIRALHRMSWRGIRIDEERLAQVRGLVDRRLELARARLPSSFNERAPTQLIKLFTDSGVTDWPTTEKGSPSFPEDWLLESSLGRDVVAVRKLSHLRDAFLKPLAEKHLYKGRVHCDFNQTRGEQFGTITGRLSSSNPNMQQVPKRDELIAPINRSIFIPDGGMVWEDDDLNQCEPRLLAHFARVKVWLDGYLSDPPIDAHSSVAQAARIDRQSGKRLNQGLLTGAGRRKVALMLGKPPGEADAIVDSYFRSLPEIPVFQKYAARVFRVRGYIRSWLGRRARLDDPRFDYRALNRILQLGNADILKKAMADVDEYFAFEGDTAQLILNCHDSFSIQYPPEARAVRDYAIRLMEDYGPGKSVHFDVPMIMESGVGRDWAEASFGVEKVRAAFREFGGVYDQGLAA